VRILYHHRTLADGAEGIHIRSMIAAFRTLGHTVVLRGADPDGTSQARRATGRLRAALPDWAAEVAALSLNVPELVMARRDLARVAPDLLYKRHGRYDVATLAAARRRGVPSLLEVNSLFSQGPYAAFEPLRLRALAERAERAALTSADVVVAVSTPLARQITNLTGRQAHVLPNGVDADAFTLARADRARIRAKYGVTDALVAGWVGILRDWHGLDLLLDAMSTLPDDVRLLVVGDGPSRAEFERQAARRGLAARVIVTGRVPHADVRDYVAAFDLAVVPDERTGVASPMKLVEYMALERVVIAPRLENIKDLVADGDDGLLFDAGSAADLARVMRLAMSDAALRARVGRGARRRVETQHNWVQVARRALDLMDAVGTSRGGTH
jgi:glycosyltransferase involved in cell wall biosynthesis